MLRAYAAALGNRIDLAIGIGRGRPRSPARCR
jgi:hypothetical protein